VVQESVGCGVWCRECRMGDTCVQMCEKCTLCADMCCMHIRCCVHCTCCGDITCYLSVCMCSGECYGCVHFVFMLRV